MILIVQPWAIDISEQDYINNKTWILKVKCLLQHVWTLNMFKMISFILAVPASNTSLDMMKVHMLINARAQKQKGLAC